MKAITRACEHCPFRIDKPGFIRAARGEEIVDSLKSGAVFPCHETTDATGGTGNLFCAGAVALMEHDRDEFPQGAVENQMIRIEGRLRIRKDLEIHNAEVIAKSVDGWIEHLEMGWG